MYEFLAPWGVLVPAISAGLAYLMVANFRRKQLLSSIEAPVEARALQSTPELADGVV